MTKDTITMTLNSEKKHSIRYDCKETGAVLSSIYVMKTAKIFKNKGVPEEIKVEISV